jgi:hypothetical protein
MRFRHISVPSAPAKTALLGARRGSCLATRMLSHHLGCEYFSDPPADFEVFIAHEHGLRTEEAARLIMDWMSAYDVSGGPRAASENDGARHHSGG